MTAVVTVTAAEQFSAGNGSGRGGSDGVALLTAVMTVIGVAAVLGAVIAIVAIAVTATLCLHA